MVAASETDPKISNISENDKRMSSSIYYTLPSAFLPLEIHFPGKNGLSHLSNQIGYILISVAGCRECMASAPQDNLGGEGNSSQVNLAAMSHALGDNVAHMGGTSLGLCNNMKKCWCASLGGTQGNLSSTHGPKAAVVICRAKGKRAQKAGLWGANPISAEEMSNKPSQEGRGQKVEPHMFTGGLVQHFSDDICCLLKTQMTI